MNTRSKFNHFILLLYVFCYSLFATDLEMRVYKVGQANTILIKKDGNLLVVDIGSNPPTFMDYVNPRILDFIQDVIYCKILITHQHQDHYNCLAKLLTQLSIINQSIRDPSQTKIQIIDPNDTTQVFDPDTALWIFHQQTLIGALQHITKPGWSPSLEIHRYLQYNPDRTQFFPGVTFEVIAPSDYNQTLILPEEPHQNNLILKIAYDHKSIILTGDAGGDLLAYHAANRPHFADQFRDTAVVVLPHHGSNLNGEQFWYEIINNNSRYSPINIISSDPDATTHNIPRQQYLEHLQARLQDRICLTSAATGLYWRVVINEAGAFIADGEGELTSI